MSDILMKGTEPIGQVSETIESGSNANGKYMKYADGTMICTKTIAFTGAVNTPSGALYESVNIDLGNFAQSFYSTPCVSLTTSTYGVVAGARTITKSYAGVTNILRSTSMSNLTADIYLIAIGRWKA